MDHLMDKQHIQSCTPQQLRERRARGEEVVVVDVRTSHARAFDPHEIPGTRWVPLSDVAAQAHQLPRTAAIVTYCT